MTQPPPPMLDQPGAPLPTRYMTEEEIRSISSDAAKEGVRMVLLSLGVDISSPEGIIQAQRDLQHLRDWRLAVSTVKRQAMVTSIIVVTTGVLGLIWLAFKAPPA